MKIAWSMAYRLMGFRFMNAVVEKAVLDERSRAEEEYSEKLQRVVEENDRLVREERAIHSLEMANAERQLRSMKSVVKRAYVMREKCQELVSENVILSSDIANLLESFLLSASEMHQGIQWAKAKALTSREKLIDIASKENS